MMLAVPESWVRTALCRKDPKGGLGAWARGPALGCTAEVPPQGPYRSQMPSLPVPQALHHLLPGWILGFSPTQLCAWLSIQSHAELTLPAFIFLLLEGSLESSRGT